MQCIWPKIRVPDLSLMYQYVFPSLVCSPLFSCGSCKILLWVFILLDILMDLHNRPHSEENLNTLKQCYGTHTTATLPDHLTIFFFKIPFVDTWAALSGRKWKCAALRTIQVFPNLQMTIWHPSICHVPGPFRGQGHDILCISCAWMHVCIYSFMYVCISGSITILGVFLG